MEYFMIDRNAVMITSIAVALILPFIIYGIAARRSDSHPTNVRLSDTLVKALNMSNIFHYEPQIDKCNTALLQALARYAQSKEEVELNDLIARYAFDTMFAITTGHQPGFLTKSLDISKLRDAMQSWKLRSIAHGSYLRFHALIDNVLKFLKLRTNLEQQISAHLHMETANGNMGMLGQILGGPEKPRATQVREACIALVAAGSDPTITHILTTLNHIYKDKHILDRLRKEIRGVKLGQPPSFKELIRRKMQMPLLHAVLHETLRLYHPRKTRCNNIRPQGGVPLNGEHESQGCPICRDFTFANLKPSIFGPDAGAWNPDRWLAEPALARCMRTHMLVFGAAANHCPGQDLHISIITKLLTQIIPFFNFEMAAVDTISSSQVADFNGIKSVKINVNFSMQLPQGLVQSQGTINIPVEATALDFTQGLTTAPQLPPGFTPIKATFGSDIWNGVVSPLTKYITSLNDIKEFVPSPTTPASEVEAVTNVKGKATADGITESTATGNVTREASPAPSAASKSSVDSNALPWWSNEVIFGGLLSAKVAGLLLSRFDPAEAIEARPPIWTLPIHNAGKRREVHQELERVWGPGLEHITDPRTMRIIIKKFNTYNTYPQSSRQQTGGKRTTTYVKSTKKPVSAPAAAPKPALAPAQFKGVWGSFAKDHAVANKTLTTNEADAACAKAAAEFAEKRQARDATGEEFVFKQTIRNRATKDSDATAKVGEDSMQTAPKVAVIPPHLRVRSVTPPHLRRAQAAASTFKETESKVTVAPVQAPVRSVIPPHRRSNNKAAKPTAQKASVIPPHRRVRSTDTPKPKSTTSYQHRRGPSAPVVMMFGGR